MRFLIVAMTAALLFAPSSFAATVRVALATASSHVTVTADVPIIVTVDGESFAIDGPVAVVATAGKLLVDGRPRRAAEVTLSVVTPPLRFAGREYRGAMTLHRRGSKLAVVNHVDLEDYVAGVIGAEMAPTWPLESLKAQAVASRSYVVAQMAHPRNEAWDVYATVASQVYRGMEKETGSVRQAVEETDGIVATYNGHVAETFFHSSSGGRTASFSEAWKGEERPYLVPTEATDEASPYNHWRVDYTARFLRQRLTRGGFRVGDIRAITPARYGRSGRVSSLRIVHSDGVAVVDAGKFRSLMGTTKLRSTRFSIARGGGKFYFVGRGYGHGVGMSQYSARGMALKGATYDQIVTHFYKGVTLKPLDEADHLLALLERATTAP